MMLSVCFACTCPSFFIIATQFVSQINLFQSENPGEQRSDSYGGDDDDDDYDDDNDDEGVAAGLHDAGLLLSRGVHHHP